MSESKIATRPNQWIADALLGEAKTHPQYYGREALRRAAATIGAITAPITTAADLKGQPGISEGTLRRVGELLATGRHIPRSVSVETKEPPAELVAVYGIGPATAQRLAEEGITTREELKRAYAAGEISLTENQATGLEYYDELQLRIPRDEVAEVGQFLLNTLALVSPESVGEVIGSYRRGEQTSGDIDILFTHPGGENALSMLVDQLDQDQFIQYTFSQGEVKYQGLYRGELAERAGRFPAGRTVHRKFDLRYIEPEAWVPALLHATGSASFNKWLRRRANDQGWTLSEHAFKRLNTGEVGGPYADEAELFAVLGLRDIPPPDRSIRPEYRGLPEGEAEAAQAKIWETYQLK